MKIIKKLFITAFVSLFALVMLGIPKASAIEGNSTPWFFSFDNFGINVVDIQQSFATNSDKLVITYNDLTGQTTGGYFDLFYEVVTLEQIHPLYEHKWVSQGESIIVHTGGRLFFRGSGVEFSFYMHRSTEAKLHTNFVEGWYYYNRGLHFGYDNDYPWDFNVSIYWQNITTGEYGTEFPGGSRYVEVILTEDGHYNVWITDDNTELYFDFEIDTVMPMLYVEEYIYGKDPVEIPNGGTTWGGAKVIYSDNNSVSMTYVLVEPSGRILGGVVDSGFTFWRKGNYTIEVFDRAGNTIEYDFTITSFGLLLDPASASPYIGTEVLANGGANGETTIHVGYTRCIYLDSNAPSQSRFQYDIVSNNPGVATVSAYGTITAISPGVATIYVSYKSNPQISSFVTITVLPN